MDHNDMSLAGYGLTDPGAVGRRLRAVRDLLTARAGRDVPQVAVAAMAGLDVGAYGHRETGRTALSPAEAWLLQERTGIDVRFLLFGDPTSVRAEWPELRRALLFRSSQAPEQPSRKGRPRKTRPTEQPG
jgi:hypothetical protein